MAIWKSTVTISNPALGGVGTNTWHCRTAGIVDAEVKLQLESLTSGLHDFYTAMANVLAAPSIVDHSGEWIRAEDGESEIQQVAGFNLSDIGAGDPLPPANAIVVGWGTSQATRSARGRTFLGPLAENTLQDNGTPTATALTIIRNGAQALVDHSEAQTGTALVVWSVKEQLARDFVSAHVRNIFAVLRSRRD
jgi:hypothetical protein